MKMKLPVTLHAYVADYEESGFGFIIFGHPSKSGEYVVCDTVEVEFDCPDREVLVNGAVAAYRAEQQRIRAEAQQKVNGIEEAISKLLCIENKEIA